jgi:hypothetical protein
MTSSPLLDLKNIDMSAPDSLSNFLKWGIKKYPAKHTMIVIGGHSGGFLGSVTNAQKNALIPIDKLTDAIKKTTDETGIKPDVIVFNSCFMGQLEPLHNLRGTADYLVASEKPEYRQGIPLGKAIASMQERIDSGKTVSPEEAAVSVVEASSQTPERTPAIAAFRADRLDKLGSILDKLSDQLLHSDLSEEEIKSIVANSSKPYISAKNDPVFSDFIDLKSFTGQIISNDKLQGLPIISTAQSLKNAMSEAMPAGFFAETGQLPPEEQQVLSGKESETPGGLSVYIPYKDEHGLQGEILEQVRNKYERLDIAKFPNWMKLRNL